MISLQGAKYWKLPYPYSTMVPFTYTSSTSRIPTETNTRYSSGCRPTKPLEVKTLPQLYDNDLNSVSKITILDGNSGAQKITEEKKVIDDFLNRFNDIQFIPDENQEPRSRFNYTITLYQDEEDPFTFNPTHVNNHYYDTEPDILPIMDGLL